MELEGTLKKLSQMRSEQHSEVAQFRAIAESFVSAEVQQLPGLVGVLLTGSTARGDARLAPLGFAIDLCLVFEQHRKLNWKELFGPDLHPEIPYHVIKRDGTLIKLEPETHAGLQKIREAREDKIFARRESQILFDPTGRLREWKESKFELNPEDIRNRALAQRFRFDYLVNEYRQEKWEYRDAKNQIAQNYNEAAECYCAFLHCINGLFIPRKDWIAYLTYEHELKPDNHSDLLDRMYGTTSQTSLSERWSALLEASAWMKDYCTRMQWL